MSRRFPIGLDAVLVTALALTRARVDTLANAVVPRPLELARQTPIIGQVIPEDAFTLLNDFLADPISQLIISTTMGLVCLYLVVDVVQGWWRDPSVRLLRATFVAKWTILVVLAAVSVGGNTAAMMSLRAVSTPSQYAHDGGVLEADLAIPWLLEGKNVYQQTWRGTWVEMAYPNGPGLSSYPYLPFAFLSGVPFYLVTHSVWGWYDHRLVYLAAYAVILALGASLARGHTERLSVLALLALNPILANDMIYGFNDTLVVALLVAAFWAYQRERWLLGGVLVGLAVATKGTVWPILPFLALWLWRGRTIRDWPNLVKPLAPIAVTALLIVGPWVVWDPVAFYTDTVAYNSGAPVPDGLPIKGWGASNFVVALGLVDDLMAPFPFSALVAVVAGPVVVALLVRQWRRNTLAGAFAHYAVAVFVIAFVSRTMNPNYLAFALSVMAMAYFAARDDDAETPPLTRWRLG